MEKINQINYLDKGLKNHLLFDINLGNLCVWACSYCPAGSHDGSMPWIPADDLIKFLKKAMRFYTESMGKDVFIFNFLGGETSLYKDFSIICAAIKEEAEILNVNTQVEFITNAYRKIDYWKKNASYFDVVKVTHHAENADAEHSTEVCDTLIEHGCHANISIPMIPDLWDKCISDIEIMKQSRNNFHIEAKVLLKDFDTDPYDYTSEQLTIFQKPVRPGSANPNHRYYRISSINNETKKTAPGTMMSKGLNYFKGFECWAGVDILKINNNGSLALGGKCSVKSNGLTDKTIYDTDINFLTQPIICTVDRCTCLPDINTRKRRV
tara:strand:- start:140 stop:1111 length:972 start_codon:yes stop_codon:yes gene_type:complete